MITPEDIKAFLNNEQLPEEKLEEFAKELDDPNSEVSRISRRSAELTRIAFDPDGPLFGLGIEKAESSGEE